MGQGAERRKAFLQPVALLGKSPCLNIENVPEECTSGLLAGETLRKKLYPWCCAHQWAVRVGQLGNICRLCVEDVSLIPSHECARAGVGG